MLPQIQINNFESINFTLTELRHNSIIYGQNVERSGALFFHFVATGCIVSQLLILMIGSLENKQISDFSKLFNTIFILLGLALLFFTQSRAAVLAFGFGFVLLSLTKEKNKKGYIFIFIVGSIVFLFSSISIRLHEVINEGINASTIEQHLVIWAIAIRMILEKPLFGYGGGYFITYSGNLGPLVHIFGIKGWVGDGAACHNIILQTTAEIGILGSLFLTIFLFYHIKKPLLFIFKRRNISHKWMISSLLMSSIVGILINFISNHFTREIFWIILGLSSAAFNIYSKQKEQIAAVKNS